MNERKHLFWGSVVSILMFGLTGCFKVEVTTEVKPNGSGMIGFAMGMNMQAKAMVASQGESADDVISTLLDTEDVSSEGFNVTSWVDGDYEWTKAEKEIDSISEINEAFASHGLFSHFSLTENKGLLRNEFVLDAEFASLGENADTGSLDVPITSILQVTYSLKLPGKIEETNGIADVNDPNRLVWMAQEGSVPLHATATTWNTLSIILMIGGILLMSLVVVIIFSLLKSKKHNVIN